MPLIKSIKSRLRDGRLHRWMQHSGEVAQIKEWKESGCPVPPPQSYKQRLIRETAARFGCRTLVETGTHNGGTIAASLHSFDVVHSIELSEEFYNAARRRFARFPKVHLWHGDSAAVLPRVLETITASALFWLDAHYSGEGTARADIDTPIVQELQTIARHPAGPHVLLIDDARLFDSTDGYPTIDCCRSLATEFWPQHRFEVLNDIVRFFPEF